MADDLDQEERIAGGFAPERMRERDTVVGDVMPRRRAQEVDDLDICEADEIDPVDARLAAQIGERADERMRSRQVALSYVPTTSTDMGAAEDTR